MPTHILTLNPAALQRGFWLYVWRVTIDADRTMLYVGRTGDNSSPHAQAPFTRMGQHLGFTRNQNALRRHLEVRGIEANNCQNFELICHGPIYPEVVNDGANDRDHHMNLHTPFRNLVGAMERQLCKDLSEASYDVLNTVAWRHDYDDEVWQQVRAAFAEHFPLLGGEAP
jgi:hypothetical protein